MPHIAVSADVMIRQQVSNGVPVLAMLTISQGSGIGVGIDRDHAIASQRRERRPHCFRCRRFSHPSFERNESDFVDTSRRLIDPLDQFEVLELCLRLTRVDLAPCQFEQKAAETFRRRALRTTDDVEVVDSALGRR